MKEKQVVKLDEESNRTIPILTVIMSMCNAERYLREAIESVLHQTFRDFEFIILDDHSSDHSANIAQSYFDERVRVIINKERIGLAKCLNLGLKKARGGFIARQDADDVSLPSRFEKQIAVLTERPDLGLVGTGYLLVNEKGEVLGKHIFPKRQKEALMKRNIFCHGSIMFRRDIIDKVGPYNELFKYSEDYEMFLRIAESCDVSNIDEALYAWRVHRGQRGGYATGLFECNYAYCKLARMLLKGNIDIDRVVRLEEDDVTALLNMREKLHVYRLWAYNRVGRYLQQHKLGRATLNVWHLLINTYASHSRQWEKAHYFIELIPLTSFLSSRSYDA